MNPPPVQNGQPGVTSPSSSRPGRLALAMMAVSGLLAACAGPKVTDYAAEKPSLDIRQYFNGEIDAFGVVTDRSGRVTRRFQVHMACSWENGKGLLDETFHYSDGQTQHRLWRFTDQGEGRFIGEADDVVGQALGQASGNAFNLRYTLAVPIDGQVWNLNFDDWMFRVDTHSVINKATMSKFGIRLGEVTVAFQRP